MEVYIVLVQSKQAACIARASSEGYRTLDEAIEFIMSRKDNPYPYKTWIYDGDDNIYSIHEINIKE